MGGRQGLNPAARWATLAVLVLLVNFMSAPLAPMPAQSAEIAVPATVPASADDSVPLLVKFKPNTTRDEMEGATRAAGGTLVREHPQLRLRVIRASAAAKAGILAAYVKHPSVQRAEVAHRVAKAGSPNDPLYEQQWALPKISWDQAYGVVPIPGSAKIAVLDTGVDATHPDLSGRTSPGQSFVGGSAETDPNGHGTALAGIAAASVDNTTGIAGVAYAGATIASVQVLQADGTGWDSDVVAGVLWAADNDAKVILMGFSSPDFSSSLQDAVNYAWDKGAVLVAATGNQGSAAPTYPAGMANVIGVAATDRDDAVAVTSNTGSAVVAAPGVDIYATRPGAAYGSISGTSAAAAETAGLAALLTAAGKDNAAASHQIRGATDPVAGRTFGRINVSKALTVTAEPAPPPSPTPTPIPVPSPVYTVAAKADMEGWKTLESPPGWFKTTLNPGDHDYNEGDVIPFRIVMNNLAAGTTWSLTIQYDFTDGSVHFFDSLATFNQTVVLTNADACADHTCTGSPSLTTIPTDPSLPAGAQIPGSFTVFNGSITTAGPTYSTATVGGNTVKRLALTGTVAGTTGTKDVLLVYGGHLARENEWGTNNGASSWPGASGKMFLINFSGSTGTDANGDFIQINPKGIAKQADLAITKTDSPDPVTVGGTLTYTITVTNNGPNKATSATVSDTLPAGTTLVSATASQGACSGTTTVMCSLGAINAAASATVTIIVLVTSSASSTLTNTATVSGAPTDPNTENNSDTETTTVSGSADLVVTKTDSPDPVTAGEDITYTIVVTNNGPSDAQNVTLTDLLPAGTTFVSATQTSGPAFNLDATVPGTLTATRATFAASASATFTVVATVSPATPNGATITNVANVTSTTSDPMPANNTATETTKVNSSADLEVTKSGSPDPVTAGEDITYAITLDNAGPSDAQTVVLSDVLPAGTTFVSFSQDSGPAFTLTTPPVGGTGAVTATIATFAAGASASFTLVVTVNASTLDGTTISNVVTVESTTTDPNTENNSDTETTTVSGSADLVVTKSDSPDPVSAGEDITYTITVVNDGPSDAQNVLLTDVVPVGTTFVSFTQDSGPGFNCTVPTVGGIGTVSCTIDTFAAWESANFTLVVNVNAAANGTTITNIALIASTSTDPDPANNTATETTTVSEAADPDLSVAMSDSPDPVSAGANITYTIRVNNAGPATAAHVVLDDPLPARTTFGSLRAAAGWTCTTPAAGGVGTVSCRTASFPNGATAIFSLVVRVNPGTVAGTVIANAATVSYTTADPNPANNVAVTTTIVAGVLLR